MDRARLDVSEQRRRACRPAIAVSTIVARALQVLNNMQREQLDILALPYLEELQATARRYPGADRLVEETLALAAREFERRPTLISLRAWLLSLLYGLAGAVTQGADDMTRSQLAQRGRLAYLLHDVHRVSVDDVARAIDVPEDEVCRLLAAARRSAHPKAASRTRQRSRSGNPQRFVQSSKGASRGRPPEPNRQTGRRPNQRRPGP